MKLVTANVVVLSFSIFCQFGDATTARYECTGNQEPSVEAFHEMRVLSRLQCAATCSIKPDCVQFSYKGMKNSSGLCAAYNTTSTLTASDDVTTCKVADNPPESTEESTEPTIGNQNDDDSGEGGNNGNKGGGNNGNNGGGNNGKAYGKG